MSQTFSQETLAAGGGNTSGGFATGTVCTKSGIYRASNKYLDSVQVFAVGDVFPVFVDNKKTTWYPLSSSLSSNKSGNFQSVKVAPGTI